MIEGATPMIIDTSALGPILRAGTRSTGIGRPVAIEKNQIGAVFPPANFLRRCYLTTEAAGSKKTNRHPGRFDDLSKKRTLRFEPFTDVQARNCAPRPIRDLVRERASAKLNFRRTWLCLTRSAKRPVSPLLFRAPLRHTDIIPARA